MKTPRGFCLNNSILEIDIGTLQENMARIVEVAGASCRVAAVVKADAYGLGAAGIAPALISRGASMLAVARCGEALELKRIHPGLVNILIMGLCGDDELEKACGNNFIITIDSCRQAKLLSDMAVKKNLKANIHIKIDTGFNRLGLKTSDPKAVDEYRMICSLPRLKVGGAFSHLGLESFESDKEQMDRLQRFFDKLEFENLPIGLKHVCDSIGFVRYPQYRLDMVRIGALLYGMKPVETSLTDDLDLRFPLRWKCPVIRIARLKGGEGVGYNYSWRAPPEGALIATLPVGYADGYRRLLSNRGEVLLKGKRCSVVGLICMDQMVIDISAVPGADLNDTVTLLGRDETGHEISAIEMAEWAGTNRNEILSSIGRRVERHYVRSGRVEALLNYLNSPPYKRVDL